MAHSENRDLNRDPISGTPGSHPVGVGVGGASGAAIGATAGALLGPIGMLIGGAVGTLAGAAAGKGVAERIDPTGEDAYWRDEWSNRPYAGANSGFDYDNDYAPAYTYGTTAREKYHGREWDDSIEADLREGWQKVRNKSRLEWEQARAAVRDAWDRSDRTYRAYETTDRYYEGQHSSTSFRKPDYSYEDDYRPAYRYGTYMRSQYAGRTWDDSLERDLESNWERSRGNSRLSWADAREAVKHAWHNVERVLPGDADRDGR